VFNEGRKDEYALWLYHNYGKNILEELNKKKNTVVKFTADDYMKMIEKWEEELDGA
jgi:hypothetical protein